MHSDRAGRRSVPNGQEPQPKTQIRSETGCVHNVRVDVRFRCDQSAVLRLGPLCRRSAGDQVAADFIDRKAIPNSMETFYFPRCWVTRFRLLSCSLLISFVLRVPSSSVLG